VTPSSLIVSFSDRVFETQDNSGRKLKVRRINALDRLRLLKAAGPELSQNDAWLNMAALTLSVVELNGIPRPFPTNERQIEAAVSDLGDDGLHAVASALDEHDSESRLFDGSPEGNAVGTPI